jgi:hypothetical protein
MRRAMIINEPIEKQSVAEEVKSDRRTERAGLTEMGSVSVETKGIARGFELGFTPKS